MNDYGTSEEKGLNELVRVRALNKRVIRFRLACTEWIECAASTAAPRLAMSPAPTPTARESDV